MNNITNPNNVSVNIPLLPPGQIIWMPRPAPIPGCPPGLEYLLQVDQLNAQQVVSLTEAFVGWDTNNKFVIRNSSGMQVYYAMEKTDTCMRICCGSQRSFTIHIVDNLNQEVFRVQREFKCCAGNSCCAGCCDCCAHEIEVSTPQGEVLGYVKQKGSFFKPLYDILDENHNPVLKLEGPVCILDGALFPCDNTFKLLTLDKSTQIGKIKKEYAGFVNEMFTSADKFAIAFPIDLSVKAKATLIGALFLIDFMFFERKSNNNQ